MTTKILVLVALAVVAGPLLVSAAPVTWDFTVNGGPDGPLAGVTASGHFTFDDSIIPPGAGVVEQVGLLTDLDFTWDGITYDETTANTGFLTFAADGTLIGGAFGTDCGPGFCVAAVSLAPSWFIGTSGGAFTYALDGFEMLFHGSAVAAPRQTPEPATLLLLASGLVGLSGLAWRRRR